MRSRQTDELISQIRPDSSLANVLGFASPKFCHPVRTCFIESVKALQQKDLVGFITLKHLMEIEQKMRRIRISNTPIPESFYEQCDSFESIFARKLNLLEIADKFSSKTAQLPPPIFFEKTHQFGPFFFRPVHMAMDLLCIFEIGKTFSFFEQLDINDKIALCSNIAMPLFVLCNGFYSVEQNCDVLCTPAGLMPIHFFAKSYFNQDSMNCHVNGS
ncbi:hypothetical protein niasHT_017759 [Heterodera trifolii]|uniref:NR LBD domain-containing protein n=1 Tax=Heterodera trifolii TaxID=157864 RepID=A0ABD2LJD3_9BILA